jgi:STE24 endopeptidase
MNEDKATRYHRIKRQAAFLGYVWTAALLLGLVVTGGSVAMRAAAESAAGLVAPAGWLPALTLLLYVGLLTVLNEAGSLPLGFYTGHLVERRYGLSSESLARWMADEAKSFALGLLFSCAGAALVYGLMWIAPGWWWVASGALFALVAVGLTNLAPVLLLPLFYTIRPLERDSLRVRLMALANRAGARVLGAYEWGLSSKTRKANAALTGLGRTRRILVSDTMLAEYSDDEIEVVLAHELAHHVHGDIWKGLAFETALVFAGCYLAARALTVSRVWLGLRSIADPAGLPLLLLAAGCVSVVMMPAAHAMSRAHERSADRFALALTGNPRAFISAMRRLGSQNLAEEHPSKVVQWLFYSHPPIRERIAAAQALVGR